MRLTSFNFSISTSLSAERLKGSSEKKTQTGTQQGTQAINEGVYGDQYRQYKGIYSYEPPDYTIPWDLALSFYYQVSKGDPAHVSTSSSMNANLNFSLTQSIKIAFSGNYNFKEKNFAAPQVRIYKDLHCWEMNLTWNPLGLYRGYRFEIRVKAPQLQDLKIERARGQFSGI